MNRGGHVFQSSPVQQMMAESPNWWNINNSKPPSHPNSPFLVRPPTLFPLYTSSPPPPPPPPPSSASQFPLSSSWNDNQELPESWSQLLLGGLVEEEDKSGLSNMQQPKKLENWEEQLLHYHHHHQQQQQQVRGGNSSISSVIDVKQESNSVNSSSYAYGNNVEFQAAKPQATPWSSQIMPVSSPNSCVTTLSNNNLLDFSTKSDGRHHPPDHTSECNSTVTGGPPKKARVQPSSTQSTFKVRKEKLGDRITALHQLVSPFGKTDTASVLLEAIGYIRFLQSQIEALSLPYLGNASGNLRQQHPVQGERNCLFPEDPGQLLNDNCMKKKGTSDQDSHEPNKDLRSRGLCLVPISCTLQVGSDNAADYWAPSLGGGDFR